MNLSKENLAVFSRTARRFTRRADAVEDIAQQAVLAILEALKKNPEKLEGMEPKRAEAYMRGTVRNCARKAHHQEKKRQERENELSTLPPDAGEVMEVYHKSHILLGLIAELPDEQRDRIWAIVGAYPSTLEQVAEDLGIRAPALRQSLQRIRKNLRERMIAIGGIIILAVSALKAFAFMTTRQDNPESMSEIADVEPSDNYQKDSGKKRGLKKKAMMPAWQPTW
mgnify:CR=1 FL=1